MTQDEMKLRIMRRIYAIYYLRRTFLNPLGVKAAALAVLAASGLFLVSVENVIRNMPRVSDIGALSQFYLNAFLHTEHTVQVLLLSTTALAAVIVRDVLNRSYVLK